MNQRERYGQFNEVNSMKYTFSGFDKEPDPNNTETKEALPPSAQYATSKINGGKSEERVYEIED